VAVAKKSPIEDSHADFFRQSQGLLAKKIGDTEPASGFCSQIVSSPTGS
jgi:hypothetical protein